MTFPKDLLRVLFLEDSGKDIEIIKQKLIDDFSCTIDFDSARTKDEFIHYIKNKKYDVILAGYTLPGFNSEEALKLAKQICPDIPFIVVSGTIGEDAAVELLKMGATDYVLKDRLGRLSFAIIRALEAVSKDKEIKNHANHQRIVRESLKNAQRLAQIGSFEWDILNDQMYGSDEVFRIFEMEPDAADAKIFSGISYGYMEESEKARIAEVVERAFKGEASYDVEYWLDFPGGKKKYIHVRGSIQRDAKGRPVHMSGTYQDLTQRKLVEMEKIQLQESIRQNAVLQAINQIYEQSVACGTMEQLGKNCLKIIEAVTQSAISFIGEIGEDGFFHDIAVSDMGWELCAINDKTGHRRLSANFSIAGLYGSALISGKSLLANKPSAHPDSMGVPEGHPKLNSFLGVPFLRDGRVAGMAAVANREGGYTEKEKEFLEAITPTIMEVLLHKRAQAALMESEEKYRKLFDSMDEGFCILENINKSPDEPADFRFVEANAAFEIQSGVRGVVGHTIREALPDESEEWSKIYDEVLKTGKLKNFCRELYATGRILEVCAFRIEIQGENRVAVVFKDISKQKYADEQLQKLKDDLAAEVKVLERLHKINSSFLHKKDMQSIYREILDAAIELTDADCGDMQILNDGQRLEIIADRGFGEEFLTYFHYVDTSEKVHTTCGEAIRNRKRVITEDIRHSPIYKEQSLKIHMNEEIICIQSTPMFSSSGKLLGMLSTHYRSLHQFNDRELKILDLLARQAADIMEMDRVQEVLKQNEKRALNLAETEKILKNRLAAEVEALKNLHNLYSKLTVQADIVVVYKEILNAAVLLTKAEQGCIQIFEEYAGRLKIMASRGLGEGFLRNFGYIDLYTGTCGQALREKRRIITKDLLQSPIFSGKPGAHFFEEEGIYCEQSTPLITGSGRFVGVLNTYYAQNKDFDILELRMLDMLSRMAADTIERAETEETLRKTSKQAMNLIEELKKADQNKNEFLSVLSHELRNPLAAISAGIQLMDMTQEKCKTEKAKEIMKRQINQLCKLVDDLLDLTRITQNKIKLKKDLVDLNEIALHIVEDIRPEFEKKGVKLDAVYPVGPAFLNADSVRITQIIGNLLTNALKFTQKNGLVQFDVKYEANYAIISIKDSGIGISPELLPLIFKPFTQADNTLDRQNGGLGLGLSIVKGIVEMHNGDVQAYSEGLGKGSLFIIYLPMTAEANQLQEKQNTNRQTQNFRKVLLIDDNRDFSEILRSMFEQMGHEVAVAHAGEEGIAKARLFDPDIIFCDIGLPDISGYEVAKKIRQDDGLKKVCMIALTGYARNQDVEYVMKSGFNKHMAKPVDLASLEKILAEFIDSREN